MSGFSGTQEIIGFESLAAGLNSIGLFPLTCKISLEEIDNLSSEKPVSRSLVILDGTEGFFNCTFEFNFKITIPEYVGRVRKMETHWCRITGKIDGNMCSLEITLLEKTEGNKDPTAVGVKRDYRKNKQK